MRIYHLALLVAGAREPSGPGLEMMPDGFSGPKLGAQFAQLVKELRSEYAGAVTACALRIASGVFGMAGRSILRALQAHGVSGTPAVMQQQVGPLYNHVIYRLIVKQKQQAYSYPQGSSDIQRYSFLGATFTAGECTI